ncbi:MAG: hypothetical protein L0312_07715, partial [Acidobacteria bacterium]|nr:hypothetical protein [Acidobacteriota bacterium]
VRLKVAYSFLAALLPRSGASFQQAGGLLAISQGWNVNAPPLVCIRRESMTPKGSQRPGIDRRRFNKTTAGTPPGCLSPRNH